jgi:plastocyanin
MTRLNALLGGVLLIAVVAVLAACSGGGAAASVSPPAGVGASIDAKDIKFSSSALSVPAGKPFQLFFRNLDGAPHNVAIYRDSSAAQPLFVGETITNAATTYQVPAIPAGTYFFRCDVHPQMTGSVVAGG